MSMRQYLLQNIEGKKIVTLAGRQRKSAERLHYFIIITYTVTMKASSLLYATTGIDVF